MLSAVDLCIPCNPRFYFPPSGIITVRPTKPFNIKLRKRPWTNDTHVTFQNINELRQFVKACFSQDVARGGWYLVNHCLELQNLKSLFSKPYSVLPEKN